MGCIYDYVELWDNKKLFQLLFYCISLSSMKNKF